MLIILKKDYVVEEKKQLIDCLVNNLKVEFNKFKINDNEMIQLNEKVVIELKFNCILEIRDINTKYIQANINFKKEKSIVDVAGLKFGGNQIQLIAGPCSVESENQILDIAINIKKSGATLLRGGIVKPRTSPYDFQGLYDEGLKYILQAKEETKLPIVCEIMSIEELELYKNDIDLIQVGARNMQNFPFLKELGKLKKPILLKRGMSATIDELLMSAEYIMAHGNDQIILCERGIRTFETKYRNTLDLNAVAMLKNLTHLPVIVDTAHGTGHYFMVNDLTKAAIAVGADGIMVEVHNNPQEALSDGEQSLKYDNFKELVEENKKIATAINKKL